MPTGNHAKKTRFAKVADRVASAERAIQKRIDRAFQEAIMDFMAARERQACSA